MKLLYDIANLLLVQNEREKRMTIFGLALFAIFMLILFLDASIKHTIVPKNTNVKSFILFLLIISFSILILMIIYYI